MDQHDLKRRTKDFALRVIRFVQTLPQTLAAKTIGKQLIRSGTSVAANYRAVCRARTKAEFSVKLVLLSKRQMKLPFGLSCLPNPESSLKAKLRSYAKKLMRLPLFLWHPAKRLQV